MQLGEHVSTLVSDITQVCTDAIVNAANSSLLGGGGVDGAIHRAGGRAILEECRILRKEQYPNGLPTGEAVATTAGKICSAYVIHTVGPVYGLCGERCNTLLAACYRNALHLAVELGCKSIAFPAISTGVYGYPKVQAARIAFDAVSSFVKEQSIEVLFVFSSEENERTFLSALPQNRPAS
jgi:O-acetyl-ADP-ribose deacetylase (regulator of RNase III)